MSPTDIGRASGPLPVARPFSPTTIIVAAALVLAAALAWVWLLSSPMRGASSGMAAMRMSPSPFSAAYLLPAFAMWSIMMVAMMVPSAAPMILLHARVDRAQSASAQLGHTLLFGFAYLLVWTSFSAVAAMTQAALVEADVVSAATLLIGARPLAAGLLLAAALYELTAAKRLCLAKCQTPLLFFYHHWRPGAVGAFRLGLVHGLYCLGCCWALMLLLFVGGVMNLAWVALLGGVVLAQKFAPPAWRTSRWSSVLLATTALGVLLLR